MRTMFQGVSVCLAALLFVLGGFVAEGPDTSATLHDASNPAPQLSKQTVLGLAGATVGFEAENDSDPVSSVITLVAHNMAQRVTRVPSLCPEHESFRTSFDVDHYGARGPPIAFL